MLLYRVISFFWSNNRATLSAYCFGSSALLFFLFIQGSKLDPDFNALSLLNVLNIIFVVFSLLLGRQLLYKFYRNKTHYFFAQLPISSLKMRVYEHISFFILCALPYLILLPFLLFQVYYNGLWSTNQVIGFLGFQLVLWLFFANYSLCLAMLGRICWYVFWGVAVGLTLYIQYNKNYQIDLMSFLDTRKVLFKPNILSTSFVFKYLGAAILLYTSAFFLSFSIDNNAFGILHAKENSLSRGIFTFYLVVLITSYFYFTGLLSLSKSHFEGLHLTQILASDADTRTEDYWSSSVQLNEQQLQHYAKSIAKLNQGLSNFSKAYQLSLPPVHYQHTPEQAILISLHKVIEPDNDLELKLNFDQITTDFYSTERDAIIEYLKLLSRGWIKKENKLIYLRGLAAHWSGKKTDPSLINGRLQFLSSYPDFTKQYTQEQWLSIYQNSGDCLFDALAASFIQNIESSTPKDEWYDFIQTGLNLDHTWVPLHTIRSVFSSSPLAEEPLLKTATSIDKPLVKFELETKELYPSVFQVHLKMPENKYKAVQYHLYPHESSDRQVDFQQLSKYSIPANKNSNGHTFQLPMLKKDQFSATFSWHHQPLDCRVYAPWKYTAL